ncbi:MAG: hypothetical protein ABI895_17895 [Deltaproteobacteria bacterium]
MIELPGVPGLALHHLRAFVPRLDAALIAALVACQKAPPPPIDSIGAPSVPAARLELPSG